MEIDTVLEFEYHNENEDIQLIPEVVSGTYIEETSGNEDTTYPAYYFRAEDYKFTVKSDTAYRKGDTLFVPVTVQVNADTNSRESTIYFDAVPTIAGNVSTFMAKRGAACIFKDFTVKELPINNTVLGRRLSDFSNVESIADYYKFDKTEHVILLNDLSEDDIQYLTDELSTYKVESIEENNTVYNILWVNKPKLVNIKLDCVFKHKELKKTLSNKIEANISIYDENDKTNISVDYNSSNINKYIPDYIINDMGSRLHRRLSPKKSPYDVIGVENITSIIRREVGEENIHSYEYIHQKT